MKFVFLAILLSSIGASNLTAGHFEDLASTTQLSSDKLMIVPEYMPSYGLIVHDSVLWPEGRLFPLNNQIKRTLPRRVYLPELVKSAIEMGLKVFLVGFVHGATVNNLML